MPPTPANDALVALLQLFEIISNPAKHKSLIDEPVRARDATQEAIAIAKLSDL